MIGRVSWSNAEVATRIEEIVVDAYGDDEQLRSFERVLDELLNQPVPAMVIGEPVELVSVRADGSCRPCGSVPAERPIGGGHSR